MNISFIEDLFLSIEIKAHRFRYTNKVAAQQSHLKNHVTMDHFSSFLVLYAVLFTGSCDIFDI